MTLYTHINKLPLSRFMDALCDEDLTALVIEGEATKEELEAAWSDLQQQYADALGDMEYRLYLSLFKEINKLSITIQQITLMVEYLRRYHVEVFVKKLNTLLGSKMVFDVTNEEQYERNLRSAESRRKGLEMQMELKTISFNRLQKKMEARAQKPSREYFGSMLNLLEEHFGAKIDEHTITVFRYVDRVKRLSKQIEHNLNKR